MATGCYVGAGGVRKLKSCQVGVGGVHKVKEIWAGISGTAKRVWRGTIPAGQKVFTSSQTWTVPEGIKTIDVFCVGGGQSGERNATVSAPGNSYHFGTRGGCGGYTATLKNVPITFGQAIPIIIGAGGNTPMSDGQSIGADTSCLSCVAKGAGQYERLPGTWWTGLYGGSGGGYPGGRQYSSYDEYYEWNGGDAGAGGSDGGNGYTNRPNRVDDNGSIYVFEGGKGQGSTTRAFGESGNTLYAGGGGGGGAVWNGYVSWAYNFGAGGNGGGGRGGWYEESVSGTANTGGGGGGGGYAHYDNSGSTRYPGGNGGSGVCIIRWAEQ